MFYSSRVYAEIKGKDIWSWYRFVKEVHFDYDLKCAIKSEHKN